MSSLFSESDSVSHAAFQAFSNIYLGGTRIPENGVLLNILQNVLLDGDSWASRELFNRIRKNLSDIAQLLWTEDIDAQVGHLVSSVSFLQMAIEKPLFPGSQPNLVPTIQTQFETVESILVSSRIDVRGAILAIKELLRVIAVETCHPFTDTSCPIDFADPTAVEDHLICLFLFSVYTLEDQEIMDEMVKNLTQIFEATISMTS